MFNRKKVGSVTEKGFGCSSLGLLGEYLETSRRRNAADERRKAASEFALKARLLLLLCKPICNLLFQTTSN